MNNNRGGLNKGSENPDLTKQMEALVARTENPRSAAAQNGKPTQDSDANKSEAPGKKLSLMESFRQAVKDKDVKALSEELGDARAKPSEIWEYVSNRWQINEYPGMADGWAAQPWEEQVKILTPMAKKNRGMKKLVEEIEKLHRNSFLKTTLEEVMEHFGVPLQTVENLVQFKNFLDRAVKADLVEVVANPNHQPENGITILTDLGDHTNHDEMTYSPRNGSKVARDAWVVVQEKHREMEEAWQDFEKLRASATPRLTPFKVSDSREGRHGLLGDLFVMPASGNWAVLIKAQWATDHAAEEARKAAPKGMEKEAAEKARKEVEKDRKVVSIIGYTGLEEKDIPAPNVIDWNHKSHSLYGSEKSDVWVMVNTALEELNARQHQRALTDMEKSRAAFGKFVKLANLLPSEPKDQGLHKILDGAAETVTICLQNFSFRKKNGKFKEGHFGIAVKCESGVTVLVDVAASECFCFPDALVDKRFPFSWFYDEKDQLQVRIDVKGFCQENQIQGRLDNSWWEGIRMLSIILRRRLKREDDLAPDEDFEDEELSDEDENDGSVEDSAQAESETVS